MSKPTDIRPIGASLYFIPVTTRMPLKFGPETVTSVTVARTAVTVTDDQGRTATGWGETPLSVTWVWPSTLQYEPRHVALKRFTARLAEHMAALDAAGHPIELTHDFIEHDLHRLTDDFNATSGVNEPMPYLAALVCLSLFDIALHDAYGVLHGVDVYDTYNSRWMNRDLSSFITAAPDRQADISFEGKYPQDFFIANPPIRVIRLPAWHLVGGLDPLTRDDLTGSEPRDGYPVLLPDWITTDGLTCLKIKLRGNDEEWDYTRLVRVGQIALQHGVTKLSADFNCTVTDPAYVNRILDKLHRYHPGISRLILYVEQPFPHDLEAHRIDVHSVSERKPLFLDESAHDWKFVRLGRELGWSGVALKTCKTQTGALMSLCWAKAHGMPLMVQDLTNPMLAQIPHCRLAAHAGTIMGVETNAMQFYPAASAPEATIHPGLYQRRNGHVDLSTLGGPGFGYRLHEIPRELPSPVATFGAAPVGV